MQALLMLHLTEKQQKASCSTRQSAAESIILGTPCEGLLWRPNLLYVRLEQVQMENNASRGTAKTSRCTVSGCDLCSYA